MHSKYTYINENNIIITDTDIRQSGYLKETGMYCVKADMKNYGFSRENENDGSHETNIDCKMGIKLYDSNFCFDIRCATNANYLLYKANYGLAEKKTVIGA